MAWLSRRASRPPLKLALQGGGAHGALAWGVLDALLEQPGVRFEALSGSSAGALNAVLLAEGWRRGGREGARQQLSAFWQALGQALPPGMVSGDAAPTLNPAARLLADWALRYAPAQLNPLGLNPLRGLLEAQIDFAALRRASPMRLYLGATAVDSGRLRCFREHELSVEVLLASTCLPRLQPAVQIEGLAYWDGGYAANPPVFPLLREGGARDILLLLLDPPTRPAPEARVAAIDARVAELGFGSGFAREMQLIAEAVALARRSWWRGQLERRLLAARFHLIDGGLLPELARQDTRLLAHGPFLAQLADLGRGLGRGWLSARSAASGWGEGLDLGQRFA